MRNAMTWSAAQRWWAAPIGGLLLTASLAWAGPIDTSGLPHPKAAQAVHEAEHKVDHAWEVYHRAALGGTIASPAAQADIENHLHQSRLLVVQAQDAAERGDLDRVQHLIGEIENHTAKAVEASREHKR